MHKTQKDTIKAVKALMRHTRTELLPRLMLAAEYQDPEVRNIQIAQNTLRTCMEAVISEIVPFSVITPAELAVRLASYAISIAPLENQDQIMDQVLATLPAAHSNRLFHGIIIQTGWSTNGLEHENVPGGRA